MSGQMINVTIRVTEEEIAFLREMLRVSRERQKDPVKFIKSRSIPDCLSHASSTIYTTEWRRLDKLAATLGVTPLFLGENWPK